MSNKFSSTVAWSPEDEGYIALCPELDDVSAFGDTPEEAVRELEVAVGLVVAWFNEKGKALPKPNFVKQYSGQFVVRMPSHLHARLAAQAKADGVSLNMLSVSYLAEASTQAASIQYVGRSLKRFEFDAVSFSKKISEFTKELVKVDPLVKMTRMKTEKPLPGNVIPIPGWSKSSSGIQRLTPQEGIIS